MKPYITSRQTFQIVPIDFTLCKPSLQAIYLYSKLTMLQNLWYSETALGTNPINREIEIHQHYVSNYINELKNLSFINIKKESVEGKEYNRNIYEILPFKGNWQAVMNDFINLTTLSAKEKGFAILLSLYKDKPKSILGISNLTGISKKTCAKYIKHLKEESVLSEDFELNDKYFPNLPEKAAKEKYINQVQELRKFTGNPRIQKQLDWLEKQPFSYFKKNDLLIKIEAGVMNLQKKDKILEDIYV